MTSGTKAQIELTVAAITCLDALGRAHQDAALGWLRSTDDIVRRIKPRPPSPHLVSYVLVVDRAARSVLLCDHRLAGLWLPTGGHVEPDEHPRATVEREAFEELGVHAVFDRHIGDQPFFLTVTETVGAPVQRHVDVTLWYAVQGHVGQDVVPDDHEFRSVRWWSTSELAHADPRRFEPHLSRAISALALE